MSEGRWNSRLLPFGEVQDAVRVWLRQPLHLVFERANIITEGNEKQSGQKLQATSRSDRIA